MATEKKYPDSDCWSYFVFHPYARLFTALSLTICNFMLYAEDPVIHAYTETELPVFGQALGLIAFDWPDKAGACFLKMILAILFMGLGAIFGRIVLHHMIFRDMLKLKCCGWQYQDVDDIRTSEAYNPTKTDTPYNKTWWGGSCEKEVVRVGEPEDFASYSDTEKLRWREGYDTSTVAQELSMTSTILGNQTLGPTPEDYTREEYQKTQETALEILFPGIFKPRKHLDHSKGSVVIMSMTAIVFMWIGSMIYNASVLTLIYSGKEVHKYEITASLGCNEYEFGKFAACLCWLADLMNLCTAFDSAFQEIGNHQTRMAELYTQQGQDPAEALALCSQNYKQRPRILANPAENDDQALREVAECFKSPSPRFKLGYAALAPGFTKFWNKDCGSGFEVRIIVIWVFSLTLTVLVLVAVAFDVANWDEWSDKYGFNLKSNELERIILASIVAIQGPLTIIQDLEWPSFTGADDVQIPGLKTDTLTCDWCPSCPCEATGKDSDGNPVERQGGKPPCTTFYITNRWLTFVPFALSLVLDYSMLFASWEYVPALYGQYVNPANDEICMSKNETWSEMVKDAYEKDNNNLIANYTERFEDGFFNEVNGTDFCLPSRYTDADSSAKFFAAMPGVLMYAFFIWYLAKWSRIDMSLTQFELPQKHEDAAATEATEVNEPIDKV